MLEKIVVILAVLLLIVCVLRIGTYTPYTREEEDRDQEEYLREYARKKQLAEQKRVKA